MSHLKNKDPVIKSKSSISAIVFCLLLALMLGIAFSVNAQSPLLKQKFSLSPYSEWGSGYVNVPNLGDTSPVPSPGDTRPSPAPQIQLVPANGGAVTELMVTQAGNVSFISISFDYDSDVVSVYDIRPGTIFDNLTEGVDYLVETRLNYATPINPYQEMVLPLLATPQGIQTDHRSYVDIMIINPTRQINYQSGSLIRIDWQVQNIAMGTQTPVVFSRLSLNDVSGSAIAPCIGPPNPSTVPTLFGVPAPSPSNPNACYNATQRPLEFPYGDGLVIGLLEVTSQLPGLTFQVGLQGLSTVDYVAIASKFDDIEITAITANGPVEGNLVSTQNGILDGTVYVPMSPPYESLTIKRPGYLTATGTNINGQLLDSGVVLRAGDVDDSGVVDIIDLTLMANALNSPIGSNELLEKMDYNGDGRIDIIDLAITSGNFRSYGPTIIQ